MLNTNFCVADEKYFRNHVYIVYFCVFKFWRGEKKKPDEYTAYAVSIFEKCTLNK